MLNILFAKLSEDPMLIVGLGNPGREYAKTRHNIGFRVLDAFASAEGFSFENKPKLEAEVAKKGSLILAKPNTYMNRSGDAVVKIAKYFNVPTHQIWVVYDDKDLEFGTLRLRESGGSGGHNGVVDIIQHLGNDQFGRFRVGILNPRAKIKDTAKYVLSKFSAAEEKRVKKDIIPMVVDALDLALETDMPTAMNKFN